MRTKAFFPAPPLFLQLSWRMARTQRPLANWLDILRTHSSAAFDTIVRYVLANPQFVARSGIELWTKALFPTTCRHDAFSKHLLGSLLLPFRDHHGSPRNLVIDLVDERSERPFDYPNTDDSHWNAKYIARELFNAHDNVATVLLFFALLPHMPDGAPTYARWCSHRFFIFASRSSLDRKAHGCVSLLWWLWCLDPPCHASAHHHSSFHR